MKTSAERSFGTRDMPASVRSSSITTISSYRPGPDLGGAMVMAAGLGTRLRPFTEHLPKPLLPLMGVPMIQFAIDGLVASGLAFEKIVLNHSHLSERFIETMPSLAWGGLDHELSDESRLLLGSGGGVRRAADLLGSDRPFLLMNADVLGAVDLPRLLDSHLKLRAAHGTALTLAIHPCSPGEGDYREILCRWAGQSGDLGRVVGTGRKSRGVPFYTGVAIIEPEILMHLPAGRELEFVPAILEPAIQAGKVGAFRSEGLWYDIGSPALWLGTHLDLISRLESGQLPVAWRRRIELSSRRVAEGIWVSRRTPESSLGRIQINPRTYFDIISVSGDIRGGELGPDAVSYGLLPEGTSLSHGVHWRGITWRQ